MTSHHAIFGNNVDGLKVYNVNIKDFEVGGISLNGAKNVIIENCDIGPSFNKVSFWGSLSAA